MSELARFWTPFFNDFNPWEPLPLDRLDTWYVRRPNSPALRLKVDLAPDRTGRPVLLAGHPANGKTTELLRLAHELVREQDDFLVYVILDESLNPQDINVVDTLFLIGAAVYQVARQEGLNPDEGRLEKLRDRVGALVGAPPEREREVSVKPSLDLGQILSSLATAGPTLLGGPVGVTVGAVVGAAATFLKGSTVALGIDSRTVREPRVEQELRAVLDAVNAVLEDVQARAGRRLLLMVDGLDKISADNAEVLFLESKLLPGLSPGQILFTAPLAVAAYPRFNLVRNLFNVRGLHNLVVSVGPAKTGEVTVQELEAGRAAMRQVVGMRFRDRVEDPDQVISPEALDHLVAASGGLMRDLIFLVRSATVTAQLHGRRRIELTDAQVTADELHRDYTWRLTREIIEELRHTHRTGQLSGSPLADELLRGNLILSYGNRSSWFDAHPILWDVIEERVEQP